MGTIKHLAWDSRFFGIKIGKVITFGRRASANLIVDVIKQARRENYKCLYSEIPVEKLFLLKDILKNNFLLVDFKVILQKTLEFKKLKRPAGVQNAQKDAGYFTDLIGIADQVAMFSRYSRDPRFGKIQAKRLYREWLRKSFFSHFSDHFLIYKNKGIPAAFLTIRIKKHIPFIDLIGVSKKMRGKGIGGKLLSSIEQELYKKGFRQLRVVTQGENKNALIFYEQKGFRVEKITIFFHKWLN